MATLQSTLICWLPANMSRNFFNILEGFQKVEESLDGPEGQYVEEIDMPI